MRAGMVVGNHRHGGRIDWNIGYSEHGAGRSIDGLEQDTPATVKSRRCGAASPYRVDLEQNVPRTDWDCKSQPQ
jgi:hypothetical protein